MKRTLPLLGALAGLALIAVAATSADPAPLRAEAPGVAAEMARAARHFLSTLTPEQKATALMKLDDPARIDWHFIPKKTRKGLVLSDMTPEQSRLAQALLATGLSTRGYVKAVTVMSLEQILFELEGEKARFKRDPLKYYWTIFGTPGDDASWGWSVEGHHLSVNFTVAAGKWVSSAPTFYGTNPDIVRDHRRAGTRALPVEQELAFELVNSLNDDQRKAAVLADKAPKDIYTSAARSVKPGAVDDRGISWDRLDEGQRKKLWRLIAEYARNHRAAVADRELEEIEKAGLDKIRFAWEGSLKPGAGHYYRIKTPVVLIEYDNIQNNANHCHAVWRNYDGDFGIDLLKLHWKKDHSE